MIESEAKVLVGLIGSFLVVPRSTTMVGGTGIDHVLFQDLVDLCDLAFTEKIL